ncbi:MAG TPA: uroporphyrinogen decarboxylase family protein [Bacteroidales bacterium]|nr:uroporphyrinogen decarboxylase family protein [Bacteroidales bacterium]
MTKRERLKAALNHRQTDKVPVDMGTTGVTGIHVLALERLRDFYGLEKRPVKLIEPFQMLGQVDDDLAEVLHLDTIGINPRNNMFGFPNEKFREYRTHWNQLLLVPELFNIITDSNGDYLICPEGDVTVPPSGKMPKTGFFFDAIIRQEPIVEENLDPVDNLEDFGVLSTIDLEYWKNQVAIGRESGKGIIANFGGTAVGDIALVPGLFLKRPKGIRDVAEWYMSMMLRPDYLKSIFEKQTDIALENFRLLYEIVGNDIDAVFLCGTDLGTQDSTFCSIDTFDELFKPYYQKMNNWIHGHTEWKTFKHCCGAVETLMTSFIESGFDIINPVQINAAGMDPATLKRKYGKDLVFWGGGVDTQKVLPFGTPADVEKQVLDLCEIFSKDGGFVFNTVHNIQANVPVENIAAIFKALNRFNGY